MYFSIEGISEQGSKTTQNQDACFAGRTITALGEAAFVCLCDGMGGTDAGELASATIVEEFQKWFYSKCDLGGQWLPDAYSVHMEWNDLLVFCNRKIIEYSVNNQLNMGSTVVIGLITASETMVMNVGDSRLYEITDIMRRLNKDHSVVGEEIENGRLSEEEAKYDFRNNQLTQCVGMLSEISPFFANYPTVCGTYLFCTDGFYNRNTNADIMGWLEASTSGMDSLKTVVRALLENARDKGEKDDISAVAVMVSEVEKC